jgi:hypothetical protein
VGQNVLRVTGIPRGVTLVVFIGVFVAAGLAAGYFGVRHARSYLRMGQAPEQITAAQAFDLPLEGAPRWVHLRENLQLNCEQALQQTSSGSVEFTEYLAQDDSGQHVFLVQYKGDTDCNTANARPFEGLLGVPPMYWWTKNNMPAPKSEPVELQVGYKPVEELYESVWAFLGALMMLGLAVAVIVQDRKMKASAAHRATYGGIPVPKSL